MTPASPPWRAATPWLAAAVLVALDVPKPLVVDDAAYFYYAQQIAGDPSDPYGFEIFWGNVLEPASAVMAPPFLPYWWGAALAWFGASPWAWKLALFPLALVLAAATWSLARRFAPGLEAPVTWLVVLSPPVAAGFNLMLDVPALTLSLAGLALFVAADTRASLALAVASGLCLGLALQTKYSAAVGAAALAAYALLYARWRLGLVAGFVALALFAGWESFVSLRYGESHFLHHLLSRGEQVVPAGPGVWSLGLLSLLGAVAGPVAVLALGGQGRFRLAALAGAVVVAAMLALPLLPAAPEARFELVPRLLDPSPEWILFVVLGAGVALSAAPLVVRGLRDGDRDARFLVAWVGLELLGFFVLSPFLAMRRVVGLAVALCFLAAHAASRQAGGLRCGRVAAVLGVALGLVFGVADLTDARARRTAFEELESTLRASGVDFEEERVFYTGHWGFQFLAERAGMVPLIADRTRVAPGDWLLVPTGVLAQRAMVPEWARSPRGGVVARGSWPWSTLPAAYGGAVPIRGQPERQMTISVFAIEDNAVAREPGRR
ncbi:MAG: hypothetical protein VX546_12765 [Myxococcota bacterium]|nr:hypothetical protein [Myxococcota bacterium]